MAVIIMARQSRIITCDATRQRPNAAMESQEALIESFSMQTIVVPMQMGAI